MTQIAKQSPYNDSAGFWIILIHPDFIHDTDDLLRPGVTFDIASAYAKLDQDVLALI